MVLNREIFLLVPTFGSFDSIFDPVASDMGSESGLSPPCLNLRLRIGNPATRKRRLQKRPFLGLYASFQLKFSLALGHFLCFSEHDTRALANPKKKNLGIVQYGRDQSPKS